jgi:hypothetical protein
MFGLNELSTYGTHPKDFDPEQVKPVLNNLKTILKWYFKFKSGKSEEEERHRLQVAGCKLQGAREKEEGAEIPEAGDIKKSIPSQKKKLTILVSGILLLVAIVVIVLFMTGIIGVRRPKEESVKSIACKDRRSGCQIKNRYRALQGDKEGHKRDRKGTRGREHTRRKRQETGKQI